VEYLRWILPNDVNSSSTSTYAPEPNVRGITLG
jgi:hypothetical protein